MAATYSVIRTEKKYSISPVRRSMLISQMENILDSDVHNCDGGYPVRSLYFDNIYDDDYIDKINGLEIRKKIRLRTYNTAEDFVKLEIKQKCGSAQLKKSLAIKKDIAQSLIKGDFSVLLNIENPLAQELYFIMQMGAYRPKCITDYRRFAFVEETNDTRITFDSQIGVSKDVMRFFDAELPFVPVYNGTVMEVKYNRFLLSGIKKILDIADSTQTSMSKYAMSRNIIG